MSKLDDSSGYGKITQSNSTLIKELFKNKVICMDENALKVTISAQGGDFSLQMVPFQFKMNFNHL